MSDTNFCVHIFKKGLRKNTVCNKKVKNGFVHCYCHFSIEENKLFDKRRMISFGYSEEQINQYLSSKVYKTYQCKKKIHSEICNNFKYLENDITLNF